MDFFIFPEETLGVSSEIKQAMAHLINADGGSEIIEAKTHRHSLRDIFETIFFSLLNICAYAALTRSFAGGYELVTRAKWPKIPTYIMGTLVGLLASHAPYKQISSANQVLKVLFKDLNPKKILIIALIMLFFGFWSGIGMAQMGASALSKMLTQDWEVNFDNIDIALWISFGMTLFSQSWMYTERVYNLQLKALLEEVRENPRYLLFLLPNIVGAGMGVSTNQHFGVQSTRQFISNLWICEGMGTLSASGPFFMSLIGMNVVYKTISHADCHCCGNRRSQNQLLLEEEHNNNLAPKTIVCKKLTKWDIVAAVTSSTISVFPNTEYNIEANLGSGGLTILGLILFLLGILYNIVPKIEAILRNKSNANSQNEVKLLPRGPSFLVQTPKKEKKYGNHGFEVPVLT